MYEDEEKEEEEEEENEEEEEEGIAEEEGGGEVGRGEGGEIGRQWIFSLSEVKIAILCKNCNFISCHQLILREHSHSNFI